MCQPPEFSSPNHPKNWICWLSKTLYRLKQSGRRWYQHLVEIFVKKLGFTHCEVDQAVFFKREENGGLTIIAVHVDDCTIAVTSMRLVENLKLGVQKYVEISDLGELHWLLGIEVKCDHSEHTVSLYQ
jgi:hypothetical protein